MFASLYEYYFCKEEIGEHVRVNANCDRIASWASYQMRKIAGCACVGNAGNVFPTTDFKENR